VCVVCVFVWLLCMVCMLGFFCPRTTPQVTKHATWQNVPLPCRAAPRRTAQHRTSQVGKRSFLRLIIIHKIKINLGICIAPTQPFRAALGAESRMCYLGNMADKDISGKSRRHCIELVAVLTRGMSWQKTSSFER
jgi:hypothetical protein